MSAAADRAGGPDSYVPLHPNSWLLGAVAIKVMLYLYTISLANVYLPRESFSWYQTSGDEADYTKPAEYLLSHGTYLSDPSDPRSGVYRMPGHSLTYLLFRIPLGPEKGKVMLVLFQVLIGGLAAYLTARLVDRNVENDSAFGYPAEWLRHFALPLPSGKSLRVGLDRVRFAQTMFDERG